MPAKKRVPSIALSVILSTAALLAAPGRAADLATEPVRVQTGGEVHAAEGVVEAVRQSVISAQVAGQITQLPVKAGDRVTKGQLLVRIDAQAAAQQASASQAQVAAAKAQLNVARKEFERQQQLFSKQYISQAALEQAEAQFKATEAAVRGSLAQAGAAGTQTGFFTLAAPFGGTVAEVSSEQGDMAMPGKPLLTLYDPGAMRVVATLPQSKLAQFEQKSAVRIELPGLSEGLRALVAQGVTVLPTADPATHTVQIRLALPPSAAVVPGMFARAYFTLRGEGRQHLMVPTRALIRRGELDAVYVVGQDGRAMLRQVRPGKAAGDATEVLAGLKAGERVALDPAAAARSR